MGKVGKGEGQGHVAHEKQQGKRAGTVLGGRELLTDGEPNILLGCSSFLILYVLEHVTEGHVRHVKGHSG